MRTASRVLTILLIAGALLGGVLLGGWGSHAIWGSPPLETERESRSSQVIAAVIREEQVALLSLSIQGIEREDSNGKLFGMDLPWSERVSFVQYSFTAKLGIAGRGVGIGETDPNHYLVTVPEFIFIGHSGILFQSAIENNGVLSWTTPEHDEIQMVNRILDDEAQQRYIVDNEEILRDQAQIFYARIIASIDPDAVVEFEYR